MEESLHYLLMTDYLLFQKAFLPMLKKQIWLQDSQRFLIIYCIMMVLFKKKLPAPATLNRQP